jgi:hypothetical protein
VLTMKVLRCHWEGSGPLPQVSLAPTCGRCDRGPSQRIVMCVGVAM